MSESGNKRAAKTDYTLQSLFFLQAAATHFLTVKQQTFADPKSRELDVRTAHYVDTSKLGKKGQKQMAKLWREARWAPMLPMNAAGIDTLVGKLGARVCLLSPSRLNHLIEYYHHDGPCFQAATCYGNRPSIGKAPFHSADERSHSYDQSKKGYKESPFVRRSIGSGYSFVRGDTYVLPPGCEAFASPALLFESRHFVGPTPSSHVSSPSALPVTFPKQSPLLHPSRRPTGRYIAPPK